MFWKGYSGSSGVVEGIAGCDGVLPLHNNGAAVSGGRNVRGESWPVE